MGSWGIMRIAFLILLFPVLFLLNVNHTYAYQMVQNEYLQYSVSPDGRFTIGTTGGDLSRVQDDNKKLLYGHPNPGTSFTTLNVDDVPQYFASSTNPIVNDATLTTSTTQTINQVEVTQELSIVKNESTGKEDTVRIRYIVTNNDTRQHQYGMRIMMDTMLGNNDAAPFRIPSVGEVTTEKEFSGDDIPQYWQAFDDISNPTVISQGTLFNSAMANKPDKVQFSNWGRVYNTLWDYRIVSNSSNGDSAVSVIWSPSIIQPRETKEFVTYYGISDFTQDASPPLILSVTGANAVQAGELGYSPNPFTITAYVNNIGNAVAQNVYLNLTLPEGLTLLSGQENRSSLDEIGIHGEKQVSWEVSIDSADTFRNLQYSVDLTSSNTDSKSVSRSIQIPPILPIERIQLLPETVIISPGASKQLLVTAFMKDGTTKDVTSSAKGTTYSSSNQQLVSVNQEGTITVSNNAISGTVYIRAYHNGKMDTTSIRIDQNAADYAKKVLFINESNNATHSINGDETSSNYLSLANMLRANDYLIDERTLDALTIEELSQYKIIVFASNINRVITDTEAEAIGTFVQQGGGLLLLGENQSQENWNTSFNKIGQKYGITIKPTLVLDQNGNSDLSISELISHEITKDVTNFKIGNSSVLQVKSPAIILGKTNSVSTPANSPIIAAASYGGGRVVAISDSSVFASLSGSNLDFYSQDQNQQLSINIFGWLMNKKFINIMTNPIPLELPQLGSHQITGVNAIWSDGSVTDITSEAVFVSSNESRMTVNATGLIQAVPGGSGGGSYIYVKYGGKTLTTLVTLQSPVTFTSIELASPIPTTLRQNETYQIPALKAVWSDGTKTDVISGITYESSNVSRMTVSNTGLIQAVPGASGGSYIYVKYGGKSLAAIVTLEAPPSMVGIELISPIPTTLGQNGSYQIAALKAVWSDGTKTDVISGITYESSNVSRMTVSNTGLIQAIPGASGGSYIYVKYGGKSLATIVTLEAPPSMVGIELISPIPTTLRQNETYQIPALKAVWSDGTKTDVISGITYESSNINRMTVSNTGLIQAVPGASGGSYIYVKYGGKTLTTIVTLEVPPSMAGIELINPIPTTLAQNGSYQISALKANWSDGTKTDVTTGITYESSNISRMTVSNTGLIQAVPGASGGSYIYVKYGGKTLTTLVTLQSPVTFTSIELASPIPTTLGQNGSYQISALKANWSDGTQTNITTGITYESSNISRMTVSNTGLIQAVPGASAGGSYIYVKYGGKTITTIVTLQAPVTISNIKLSEGIPAGLAQGSIYQIKDVIAVMSDGTETAILSGVIYESSQTNRFTVSSSGLIAPVFGAPVGVASYIYVKYNGKTITSLIKVSSP